MLHQKEMRMLQFLVENKKRFVTSKELAVYLGCSDRTVRTYYKTILNYLKTVDNDDTNIFKILRVSVSKRR